MEEQQKYIDQMRAQKKAADEEKAKKELEIQRKKQLDEQ